MKYPKLLQTLRSNHAKAATLFAIIAIAILPTAANAAKAEATVSKNIVKLNEAFQLTISVDESLSNDALNLTPLNKSFNYGRPHISNSTSIINGKVNRLTEWRIALAAKETGRYNIPSFNLNGLKTLPISITVIAKDKKDTAAEVDAIQLQATLKRNQGYISESFSYHVRLMIGTRVESPSLAAPFGEGLTVEQIGEDIQAETVINGRRFIVVSREYQITPTTVGKLTIEGAVFTGTEVTRNQWGPALAVPISKQAKNITLTVKDKPASYTGLWLPTPALELSQHFEPDSLNEMTVDKRISAKVGEPINRILTLKIKNIAQSAMPDLNVTYPKSVRMYSDKPVYRDEGDFRVMQVKQVIIPREQGEITLPAISIKWFNIDTEREHTTDIDALTLNVEPAEILTSAAPIPAAITSVPSSLNQPNMVQVTSAGYWPVATGFFALLWLTTMGLYYRQWHLQTSHKNTVSMVNNHKLKGLDELEAATKSNDALRVATEYNLWDSREVDPELYQQINTEIQAMMASHYRKKSTPSKTNKASKMSKTSKTSKESSQQVITAWDNTQLLALLKKSRNNKTQHPKDNALKELD